MATDGQFLLATDTGVSVSTSSYTHGWRQTRVWVAGENRSAYLSVGQLAAGMVKIRSAESVAALRQPISVPSGR